MQWWSSRAVAVVKRPRKPHRFIRVDQSLPIRRLLATRLETVPRTAKTTTARGVAAGHCRHKELPAWPKPSLGLARRARDASLSTKTDMLLVLRSCRVHVATTTSMPSPRGLPKRQGHRIMRGVVVGKTLVVPTAAEAVGDVAAVAEAAVRQAKPTRLSTTMRIKCPYQHKTTNTKFRLQVRHHTMALQV